MPLRWGYELTNKMADAPKTNINKLVWETLVREHMYRGVGVDVSGTFDSDLAKVRQVFNDLKSGKVSFHPSVVGNASTLQELESTPRGKYAIDATSEEALLKDIAKKFGEERMEKGKYALQAQKHELERAKLAQERAVKWEKIEAKLPNDFDKRASAWADFHAESDIIFKKHDLKKEKFKSHIDALANSAKTESQALSQHRTLMALPEKERAAKLKESIAFWQETVDNPNVEQKQKDSAKVLIKRLQELGEADGVTKPKLSRAIAAVGGAVKAAGAAVLPAQPLPKPSEVVRPTTTATSAPIPPKPATPVPAVLPPPPSAAPVAGPTSTPAGLPPPPRAATIPPASTASGTVSTPPVWTGPNTRAGVPAPAVPADDAQAQLARLNGQGGVAGVSRGGVAVNLTTAEELAGTKPAPVDKTNANSIRPPSYENPVQVKVDTPSETTAKQTELRRAQLEEQARTGKLPPKSGVSAKLEEGGSLLDIAKRQLPTVFKVANYITGTSLKDINKAETERLTAEAKVKADAKAALARLTEKPAKTFYNPNTGRSGVVAPQLTAQQASGVMSPLGDRISRTLYSDILPYARGIQNPQVQLPAVFGNDVTQKSFIEKALVRSGRFTADEIGGVVRSILNNPDAMSELTRVIGHLPVENQPLKSGGAPKPFPQRPTGNSLPKVTPVVETARDRLAAQKAQQEAVARAAQEAELLRIAAEEKAAFDLNKHNVLVEQARKADEAAQALIAKNIKDEIRARSPAGTEDAWVGTPFSQTANSSRMPSGVTRLDRLRQIAVENKRGVNPLEIKLARLTGGQPNTNIYGDQMGRTLRSGQAPPSAGARVAGQVGNVGAQSVGFLPDIMTAYALSRGGPISGSGQVLYPSEVSSMEGNGSFENAALSSLARWHPDNAAENPDITHQQRNAYWEKFYGNSNVPRWYNDEYEAKNLDLADWVKRTGFTPEPMRGSQPVPQAILDAIRSQR